MRFVLKKETEEVVQLSLKDSVSFPGGGVAVHATFDGNTIYIARFFDGELELANLAPEDRRELERAGIKFCGRQIALKG